MRRMLTILAAATAVLTVGCGGEDKPAVSEHKSAGAAEGHEAAPAGDAQAKAAPSAEVAALKGIAVAVLKAYKAKDVAALSAFAPAEARDMVKRLAPGDAAYERLFDETNWRWKAAKAWDGAIHGVRISGEDEAWLKYGELEGEELAVVKLKNRDGAWIFDDFKSPSKKRWDAWGQPKE